MRVGLCLILLGIMNCNEMMLQVNNVQRTLVEAWGIVRETYVDPTFNNQDWDLKLEEVLGETLSLKTSDAAYAKIRSMLATLGDPFTRIVNPQVQYLLVGSSFLCKFFSFCHFNSYPCLYLRLKLYIFSSKLEFKKT
jgi:hypothetical protein